jgi:indoleamine 2,3-dioxygenase
MEKRRLMVILAFAAHGYVWGNGDQILDRLPPQIAVPLDLLSNELGTVPLGTYATTVLWNSRRKNPAVGWSLDNVSIDFTFTGTKDEAWFYTVR